MKERQILFSAPMVRAILDGSKTQTRRISKVHQSGGRRYVNDNGTARQDVVCPYGQPGDRLWVREACRAEELPTGEDGVRYLADDAFNLIDDMRSAAVKWLTMHWYRGLRAATVPPIHMPRWASRIDLLIKSVRVERLQDISEPDCWAEGIAQVDGMLDDLAISNKARRMGMSFEDAAPTFAALWESINGAGSWEANPWVWVVEFERIKP